MTTILHILQHSLGRDEYGRPRSPSNQDYRNRFVAGGDDVQTCREAVRLGLMVEHRPSDLIGGLPCFHVTDIGKKYIAEHSPTPPKISRGRRRYLRWLEISDAVSLSFGEWLRSGLWRHNE